MMKPDDPIRPSIFAIAVGYFAACIAGTIAFSAAMVVGAIILEGVGIGKALGDVPDISGWVFIFLVIAAWPGFIVLRLLLLLLGWTGWIGFAVAGTLNATVTLAIFRFMVDGSIIGALHPIPLFMGVVAGLAAWVTEREFTRLPSSEEA